MPSQTFTASTTTSAAPPAIWKRLQIPETWEGITGVDDIFDPVFEGGGNLMGFKFHSTAAGQSFMGTAAPGPREDEKSLQWDIATSEITGWVRVEVSPTGESTRIEVTMRVESVSALATFGFPMIAGAIASGFQDSVEAFAASLER